MCEAADGLLDIAWEVGCPLDMHAGGPRRGQCLHMVEKQSDMFAVRSAAREEITFGPPVFSSSSWRVERMRVWQSDHGFWGKAGSLSRHARDCRKRFVE